MKKKLLIFILAIIVLTFFYKKKIFEFIIIKKLSDWTEYRVNLNIAKFNFNPGYLEIINFRLINNDNFSSKNLFESELIKINFRTNTVFQNKVEIDNIFFLNPKLFFEIKNNDTNKKVKIIDNLKLVENLSKKKDSKMYPKKNKDKNFIIYNLSLNDAEVYLKYPENQKNYQIKLSDMSFRKVGNLKNTNLNNSQHFKDVLKIMLNDIYFRIPDEKFREFIKENYKLK